MGKQYNNSNVVEATARCCTKGFSNPQVVVFSKVIEDYLVLVMEKGGYISK